MMKDDKMCNLEQKIQECWQVVDDLKAVYHCERLYSDENDMQNALLGLFTLYQIKFENLFHEYEKVSKENTTIDILVGGSWKCSRHDPCKCEKNENRIMVNHDLMWHDGDVIHDPNTGGCGKWIGDWDAG